MLTSLKPPDTPEVTEVLSPLEVKGTQGGLLGICEVLCMVLFLFVSKTKLTLKNLQSAAFPL